MSDGWCIKCGARGALSDGLDSLRKIIPWKPNFSCLSKIFENFELFNRFLECIEALIMPCKDKLPTRAQCRQNATFEGTLKESDYVSPKDWPCLQKALTARQFYNELRKLYKLVNPCIPKGPVLDLDGKNPSELKNDANVSLWVHAVWWIWWYFLSGQVTFSLARRNKPDLKSTVYDNVLFKNAFNPEVPTKIIIHGFVNNHRSSIISMIRQVYTKPKCGVNPKTPRRPKYPGEQKKSKREREYETLVMPNIIIVNWASMSYEMYLMTRLRVVVVARQALSLIRRLQVDFDLNLDSLDIVGHSLGAHIAGVAGNVLADPGRYGSRAVGGRKIGQITALTLASWLPDNPQKMEALEKFCEIRSGHPH
uniref:Hepatic triacylglycerol lipase n=1 Tax=Lygus hesperus TaxID=30085 RepID=A0A0A9XFM2_LYGHE